uniref:Uncharacterized protein n=1 Tax=Laticauda laticaudata TaxID=8630 RepID=A0A8C5WR81_LATLA
MSGSRSVPGTGAALFNRPTSSSNSDANTEEGSLMVGCPRDQLDGTSSEGPEASFKCCK